MNIRFTHIARLACVALAAAAHAAPVPIVNHSFEDPVLDDGAFEFVSPGWTRTNSFCGVFNPTTAAFPGEAPDGQNVAFLDANSQLSQRLNAKLQPNTRYTLTVDYGSQLSFAGLVPYVALLAGSGILVETGDTVTPAPAGTFRELLFTFTTGDEHLRLGQGLTIVLDATAPGIQVDYDNIRLDATQVTSPAQCVRLRQLIATPNPEPFDFGDAIALSDDTAVIYGSPSLTLHFYSRVGDAWTLTQSIPTPPTALANPPALALEGDTLVLGSNFETAGATASGAAHLFRRMNGVWAYDGPLAPATPEFNARFGETCDLQSDRIIIGAPGASGGNGHATVFRRSGSTWIIEQTLVPASVGSDRFGTAVAIEGEFAFIASQLNSVAVFKRSGNTWTELAPLQGTPLSGFGRSIDADDGTLIVGAAGENNQQGAAYVYRAFAGQWILEQRLTHPTPMNAHRFGATVKTSRGRAVVHTPEDYDSDGTWGSISVFQRGLFNWTLLEQVEKVNPDPFVSPNPVAIASSFILFTDRVIETFPEGGGGPRRLVASVDLEAPAITQHPQNQAVNAGDVAVFTVESSGQGLLYQWWKNGAPLTDSGGIMGASTATLTINEVGAADSALYGCIISSAVGCEPIFSNPAFLAVDATPACPGDANGNGEVSFSDITFVLNNWGFTCP